MTTWPPRLAVILAFVFVCLPSFCFFSVLHTDLLVSVFPLFFVFFFFFFFFFLLADAVDSGNAQVSAPRAVYPSGL